VWGLSRRNPIETAQRIVQEGTAFQTNNIHAISGQFSGRITNMQKS
jgi:hypothetical protein